MSIIQQYMQWGGALINRPWQQVQNMAHDGYRWLYSGHQGNNVVQLQEVAGELPEMDPQYAVRANLVERLHPAYYALEGVSELLSSRAIATINAVSAYQTKLQEKRLCASLQRGAQTFLDGLPGSAASEQKANAVGANEGFFSWLRKTPEQKEAVKAFVAQQEKGIEQIQKRENELTAPPPIRVEQKVWAFLKKVPGKLHDLARWIGYVLPLRPTPMQGVMMRGAQELINDLKGKIDAIDNSVLGDVQAVLKEGGDTNRLLENLYKQPVGLPAAFPFYSKFDVSHRGGNLLKGAGEFIVVESDRPITPEIPIDGLRNLGSNSNIPVKIKHKDLGSQSKVLETVKYPESITRAKVSKANVKVYRIPVQECANGSVMDAVSIGTRQRYDINGNNLVFSNKNPGDDHWDESSERTAAIERMQAILIMQELIKLSLHGKLNDLSFNEYKNAIAFLSSIKSNDLARKEEGGFSHDPMYRDVSTLFNNIKETMDLYMFERHVQETGLRIIESKKPYNWHADKMRYTHLMALRDSFPLIQTKLSAVQKKLEIINANGSLTWMIGEFQKINERIDEIRRVFTPLEFTSAEAYFQQRHQIANAEIPANLCPLIQQINQFYASTTELSILSQSSVFHDVFEECKRSLPKRLFGRETEAHRQLEGAKQEVFQALELLNAGLPKFDLEMESIVSAAPYDRNIETLIVQQAAMKRAFDRKEAIRERFAAKLRSKPYDEAMRHVVPKPKVVG